MGLYRGTYNNGMVYTLYRCPACESRFFDPEEHPVTLKSEYDGHAVANAGKYRVEFTASAYWKGEVGLLGRMRQGGIRSVLDIGCRTGDFLMHWPATVDRCGIELSAYSAEVARKRGLAVYEGFLEDFDPRRRFDVVTLYAILEHLRKPLDFFERLPALVEPGGIAVIMVPTFECLKEKALGMTGRQWHMYSPPEHLNFISRKKLDGLMSEFGFRLACRRFTSGGMFNPFSGIPLASKAFHRVWALIEAGKWISRWPIFDHMFSYYEKR